LWQEMPICKHVLAGMMVSQLEKAPKHWYSIQAQQQRGRDTFGMIQQAKAEREPWSDEALQDLGNRSYKNLVRNAKAANRKHMQPHIQARAAEIIGRGGKANYLSEDFDETRPF
jgi:hypothetical protein